MKAIVAPTVSPEITFAIGEFIVGFAELEYTIKLGIQTLLDCPPIQKAVITGDQNFVNLIKILRTLYTKSENKRVSEKTINDLCKKADNLRNFRNQMMHSSLTGIDNVTVELEKRRRKDYDLQIIEISLAELQQKTKETLEVAGEFLCIWMGYHQTTPRVI